MPSLSSERLLRESLPVALILLVWGVVALFLGTDPTLATAVRLAGLVVAGLYAVVRGRALAADASAVFESNDLADTARTAVEPLLPALTWFVLAVVVDALAAYTVRVGLFSYPEELLVYVLAGAGVTSVLLYAVAAGFASVVPLDNAGPVTGSDD